jgi:hypothetical protein
MVALVVFGGISGSCEGPRKEAANVLESVSDAAWLYVPQTNRWLPVHPIDTTATPTGRYKHACVASQARAASVLCVGGLAQGGRAQSDAWLLEIRAVDMEGGSAEGAWTLIQPAAASAGPRHSFALVSSMQPAARSALLASGAIPGRTSQQEGFLMLGGATSDEGERGGARSDVWMLSVSFAEKCGRMDAAWFRLFPGAAGPATPMVGIAAVVDRAGHLLVYGGYNAESPPHPLQGGNFAPVIMSPLRQLHGSECLALDTALSPGCPATQQPRAGCVAAADRANLAIKLDMNGTFVGLAASQRAQLLENLVVSVYDKDHVPLATSLLPNSRRMRGLSASRKLGQNMSTLDLPRTANIHLELKDVLLSRDDSDVFVVVSALGLQLAMRSIPMEPGHTQQASVTIAHRKPLAILPPMASVAQNDMKLELFLWHRGVRTAWQDLGPPLQAALNGMVTWQVCTCACARFRVTDLVLDWN